MTGFWIGIGLIVLLNVLYDVWAARKGDDNSDLREVRQHMPNEYD